MCSVICWSRLVFSFELPVSGVVPHEIIFFFATSITIVTFYLKKKSKPAKTHSSKEHMLHFVHVTELSEGIESQRCCSYNSYLTPCLRQAVMLQLTVCSRLKSITSSVNVYFRAGFVAYALYCSRMGTKPR